MEVEGGLVAVVPCIMVTTRRTVTFLLPLAVVGARTVSGAPLPLASRATTQVQEL